MNIFLPQLWATHKKNDDALTETDILYIQIKLVMQ